jgi:branched-chain amino acid aminotransferase
MIYVNGEILHRQDAKISVFDSGFLLGDGIWEGIRLLNGHLVFLEEHLNRLYDGANQLEIDIGFSKRKLTELIFKTIKSNNMHSDVHIRLIISRGLKKTPYQHPNANIGPSTIVIIPEYKKADRQVNKLGISLKLVSTRRGTPDIQDPRSNTKLREIPRLLTCLSAFLYSGMITIVLGPILAFGC